MVDCCKARYRPNTLTPNQADRPRVNLNAFENSNPVLGAFWNVSKFVLDYVLDYCRGVLHEHMHDECLLLGVHIAWHCPHGGVDG